MKNSICIAIIGKDCEDKAVRLNKSSKLFDEKIYVDDYSSDNSIDKFSRFGFKTFKRHLNDDFSSQRNYVLDNSISDWLLFLDSDEKITKTFYKEAIDKINNGDYVGFIVPRKVDFLGRLMKGTEMGCDFVLRLANKKYGRWERKVHEIWDIKGDIGKMESPIIHYTAINLNSFIKRLGKYSKLHALEKSAGNQRSNILKVVFLPILKFVHNFLILKGFKDITYGFVVSVLMSFHSFLSWSHLWLIKRR